jgi:hypothetical protein
VQTGTALEAMLRSELSAVASVINQTDGRSVFRVGGPRVRDVLAKGVPIDLDERVFRPQTQPSPLSAISACISGNSTPRRPTNSPYHAALPQVFANGCLPRRQATVCSSAPADGRREPFRKGT